MKAWVCYLKTNPHDHAIFGVKVRELIELARAAGFEVVGETIQLRLRPDSRYLLGRGKIAELRGLMKHGGAEVAIFYDVLTSSQKHNITIRLGKEVIDRYDLTLRIFESACSDRLSKLQIRLASLEKAIPYEKLGASLMFRRGREHPGPMSMGEYAFHNTVANFYKMKSSVKREIEAKRSEKLAQLKKRKKLNIPTVCLAGYYNAGKTSLFNALTGLKREVRPTPFTTLASKYCKADSPGVPIMLVDTIGFAMDLDPRLIASFSPTLDDIRLADIVLLVVDMSDELALLRLRVKTCADTLASLGVGNGRVLVAANKIDKLNPDETEGKLTVIRQELGTCPVALISVKDRKGIAELAQEIADRAGEIRPKHLVEAS